jgi:cell division protein FtsB
MDESFEKEIAELQAEVDDLRAHLEMLRSKAKPEPSKVTPEQDARYSRIADEKKSLKRQIAAMEGRPYHDEDDPESTYYGEPPEPPDQKV